MKSIVIAGFLLLVTGQNILAQDCEKSKTYKQCEFPEDNRFESKFDWNKTFRVGQTKQYVLTFNKGRQYFISVCSKRMENKIHIKLREDNEKQDIVYDNAINELSGVLEMHFKETKKMILEVSIPPAKIGEDSKYVCVGMRMYYRYRN